MLDIRITHCPTIVYRPIRASDLDVLEHIHAALFPIRYERDFFVNVVNGHGIVSWAAVDISSPDGRTDEVIGFVTTRLILAKDSEIEDLLSFDVSRKDQSLVYILTLGVVEQYRNLGIANALVQEVIKYASGIVNCKAVYLHVIAYNQPAIKFYQKMLFKLVRRLPMFYYIKGQHFDSYLFVYYINGGRSPCSPIGIVAGVAAYIRGLFKMLSVKLWKYEEKRIPRWSKCKETESLLVTQNKRILTPENPMRQCV